MASEDISIAYRVGIETAREAVHLTCAVLWNRLKDLYMAVYTTGCIGIYVNKQKEYLSIQ